VLQRIQDNTIELPYIEFLMRNNDEAALGGFSRGIHEDEQSMRVNNIRYNRRFYKRYTPTNAMPSGEKYGRISDAPRATYNKRFG
jgi:hypothetical protein